MTHQETIALLEEVLSSLDDNAHGELKAKVTAHIPRIVDAADKRRELTEQVRTAFAESVRLKNQLVKQTQHAVKQEVLAHITQAKMPAPYGRNLRLAVEEIDVLKNLDLPTE